jgi:hypothetical protein
VTLSATNRISGENPPTDAAGVAGPQQFDGILRVQPSQNRFDRMSIGDGGAAQANIHDENIALPF